MVGIPVIRILNIMMTGFFRTEFRTGDKCWSIKERNTLTTCKCNVQNPGLLIDSAEGAPRLSCGTLELEGESLCCFLSVTLPRLRHILLVCSAIARKWCSVLCFFTRVCCMKLWSFTRFSGFYQSVNKINLLKIMFSELSYIILSDILI